MLVKRHVPCTYIWPIADEGTVPTPLRLSFKIKRGGGMTRRPAGAPMAQAPQKGKSAGQFDEARLDLPLETLELDLAGFAELQTVVLAEVGHHI